MHDVDLLAYSEIRVHSCPPSATTIQGRRSSQNLESTMKSIVFSYPPNFSKQILHLAQRNLSIKNHSSSHQTRWISDLSRSEMNLSIKNQYCISLREISQSRILASKYCISLSEWFLISKYRLDSKFTTLLSPKQKAKQIRLCPKVTNLSIKNPKP